MRWLAWSVFVLGVLALAVWIGGLPSLSSGAGALGNDLAPAESEASEVAASDARPNRGITVDWLTNAPLTISVSTYAGGMCFAGNWDLSVNSAGQAELRIWTYPEDIRRRVQLTDSQLAEFRKALVEERFFDMPASYGEAVACGGRETLTVTVRGETHTVRLFDFINWRIDKNPKLREASRAFRLMILVRGWFDEPDAIDLRDYYRQLLDVAKKK